MWGAIPDHFILDWDSTVLVRYGDQEGAVLGYNPEKRGRKSHHPLLAEVAYEFEAYVTNLREDEAITTRKWFMLIVARLVKSGRQKTLQIADFSGMKQKSEPFTPQNLSTNCGI